MPTHLPYMRDPSRAQSSSARPSLNTTVKRKAALRRDRLIRLLSHTVERHGIQAVVLIFERIEAELDGELQIDCYLEHLADADPAALRRLEAAAR